MHDKIRPGSLLNTVSANKIDLEYHRGHFADFPDSGSFLHFGRKNGIKKINRMTPTTLKTDDKTRNIAKQVCFIVFTLINYDTGIR